MAGAGLALLARSLHAELGGHGIGVVGMCFTGGFALAMMVDPVVAAPVVAQPSLPFAIGRKRGRDLNLSPADLDAVKARAAAGCRLLGLQYKNDRATGKRFDRLEAEIGAAFVRIEFLASFTPRLPRTGSKLRSTPYWTFLLQELRPPDNQTSSDQLAGRPVREQRRGIFGMGYGVHRIPIGTTPTDCIMGLKSCHGLQPLNKP